MGDMFGRASEIFVGLLRNTAQSNGFGLGFYNTSCVTLDESK